MAQLETCVFRASFAPKIYRDFEIESRKSLHDLAEAIVEVFGFEFDHAFGFYSSLKGRIYDSPVKYTLFADMGEDDGLGVKRTRIEDAFPVVGTKMTFLFDYGDGWVFRIELTGHGRKTPRTRYPRSLKTVGEAPLQYPDPDEEE